MACSVAKGSPKYDPCTAIICYGRVKDVINNNILRYRFGKFDTRRILMIINLVKTHDTTKGPEAHQVYIFDLQSEEPGQGHTRSFFEFEGERYRAFATHSQASPIKIEGKLYPVARVRAVKVSDEVKWHKNGRHGEIAEWVLAGHVAK